MENCVFCKIARGEIAADFVYQDEEVVAFRDQAPAAPVHILIIPRRHIPTFNDLQAAQQGLLGRLLFAAQAIARQENIHANGYRLQMNCGPDGGQEVNHLHFHLLGGQPLS